MRDLTPFGGRDVDKFWLSRKLQILIASINLEDTAKHERWIVDTTSGALSSIPKKQDRDGTSIAPEDLFVVEAP
ncbi:hypothetical protein BH10CYA1_BH10CYA1_32970 [soil metagenome]